MNRQQVNDLFYYRDGNIFWRKNRGRAKKDTIVSSNKVKGYKNVRVNGSHQRVHRVIFLIVNGYLPEFIDHIDCNKHNNSIDNLRACTLTENMINVPKQKRNTSGEKGVIWNINSKKWLVYVSTPTVKQRYFGGYVDFELAQLVAIEARSKYQGEFCNHN